MKRDLNYFLNKTTTNKDCLEWNGCYNTDGYPRCSWKGSANGKLHRVIWELQNKIDPVGKVVRHTCDNIKCINPNHLILGSSIDNVNDRTSRDRAQGLKQRDVNLIKELFTSKKYSSLELSKMFNVSRRTIYYTVNER